MQNLTIIKTETPKQKPTDENKLAFGEVFTDHMLLMNYTKGKGWHDARIVPYGPLSLDPAAMVIHYSQTIFEGLKAYKSHDGKVMMFRPELNCERLNTSNARMAIPQMDEEFLLYSLNELVKLDSDWIPTAEGCSLYVRPTVFATEAKLGVKPADEYLYMVILSPSGSYYKDGLKPVKIYVEEKYVRAVPGGTGEAKTGGNYASSLMAQSGAYEQGYSQVLWLDGISKKYIEEIGTTNAFFIIGDEIITPELNGSILNGITRRSVLELVRKWGMKVSERRISIDEVIEAYNRGELKEVFASGTAAVISPVGELKYKDIIMNINDGEIGEITQKIYDAITGIQLGKIKDDMNWTYEVK